MTRLTLVSFCVLAGCGNESGDTGITGGRPRDSVGAPGVALRGDSGMRHDSGTGRDSTALRDTVPHDPPCFASYIGLPCRQP